MGLHITSVRATGMVLNALMWVGSNMEREEVTGGKWYTLERTQSSVLVASVEVGSGDDWGS